MIKTQLTNIPLPINDLEGINSWENLELTLLKLGDEQFDILLKDRLSQIAEIEAEKLLNKTKVTKRKKKKDLTEDKSGNHGVPLHEIEDPFIQEMERSFRSGDTASVFEMMSKYNK